MSKCKLIIHIASNLNQDFTNALDFDEKTVFRKSKFVGKLALKDAFIWSIYTIKTSNLAFFVHSRKSCSGKSCFFSFKYFFLDQNFWKYSVFESFVVQSIKIWIKKFKCVRVRAVSPQLDKFWIEILRACQISKKKVLQRIRFWSEIDL